MQSGRAFFAFARFTILGGLSKKIKPKLNPARKICTWLFHDALKYKMSLLLAFNYSQRCTTHTFLQPLFFKTSKYPGSAKTDLAFYSQPMFQTIQRNHDSEESYWKNMWEVGQVIVTVDVTDDSWQTSIPCGVRRHAELSRNQTTPDLRWAFSRRAFQF